MVQKELETSSVRLQTSKRLGEIASLLGSMLKENATKEKSNHLTITQKPTTALRLNYSTPVKIVTSYNHPISDIRHETMIDLTTNLKLRLAAGRSDPLQDFVNLINKAKNEKKIFTICGTFGPIRRSLFERGWIEKPRQVSIAERDQLKQLEHIPNAELYENVLKGGEHGERCRRALVCKLLARHQVDFYWDYSSNPFNVLSDKFKRTLVNRYPGGCTARAYGSKAGLCDLLSESHWYWIDGVACVRHPRTYNLAKDEERASFIEDYRQTAAASLLKWVLYKNELGSKNEHEFLLSDSGKIPVAVFNFAVLQCQKVARFYQHKDIDDDREIVEEEVDELGINEGAPKPPRPQVKVKDADWDVFLDKFYKLVHGGAHFRSTERTSAEQMVRRARLILAKLERHEVDVKTDGFANLWLLKPHNGSQGYGIIICRTLKYILDTVTAANHKPCYVVQKYLERPLLIHGTKFDIRQWFLVTHQPTLQLWMYNECYIRFSGRSFSLKELHESIHLTNNSVQCRYKPKVTEERHPSLPKYNMWTCDQFRKWLADDGRLGDDAWERYVRRGMREAITATLMCCNDKIIGRVNSFELCGADFMLDEKLRPYLIEINTRPALHASTPVTAKMCPAVLEDLIKVVVDHARNPKASTGKFELIYKESIPTRMACNDKQLIITGVSYFGKYKQEQLIPLNADKEPSIHSSVIKNILNIDPEQVRRDVRKTLEKILSIIHVEREKRIQDDGNQQFQSETFKNMLAEFVNIISSTSTDLSKSREVLLKINSNNDENQVKPKSSSK